MFKIFKNGLANEASFEVKVSRMCYTFAQHFLKLLQYARDQVSLTVLAIQAS